VDSDMKDDVTDDGPAEDAGPVNVFREAERSRRPIPFGRRKELLRMAEGIVADVLRQTEPHERCLLRRMVESLTE
jgi:hypothetical protein